MTFENVIAIPASTTGGQQGVIAQDWLFDRLERKRERPLPENLYPCLLLVLGHTLLKDLFIIVIGVPSFKSA
ncbi:MAG: hypothetical protein GX556_10470 [Fibrobacter sp.]|nr:hypothetical protein [Fibrobacter sp.]